MDTTPGIEAVTQARRSRIRLAAELGVAGQVALTSGWVIATLLQDGKYDAARDEMSDMAAVGVPHAWFVLAYMGFAGLTTILFAWGALRPLLAGVKGRTLAAVLLSLTWGLGNLPACSGSTAASRTDAPPSSRSRAGTPSCTPHRRSSSCHCCSRRSRSPGCSAAVRTGQTCPVRRDGSGWGSCSPSSAPSS